MPDSVDGERSEDENNGDKYVRRRPQMSYGSIIAFAALIGTALLSGAGAVYSAGQVTSKLDSVSEKVSLLGDVKTDVARLQVRMDAVDSKFSNLGTYLQHLSDKIDISNNNGRRDR